MTAMSDRKGPARVHVLVDLERRPDSGGHVKSWERLAVAAMGLADALDLTVHFAGPRGETRSLSDNVRFVTHRSVFSSARVPFLAKAPVPDHADLAPYHPDLARSLESADVVHTTDGFFAFARTAERVVRRRRVPLVTSIHTDTPRYTSLFTAATIEHVFGRGRIARLFADGLALPRRAEAGMLKRFRTHQRRCAAVVVSRPDQIEPFGRLLAPRPVSLLRRGIERDIFHPQRAQRRWLEDTFDIPEGRIVVLMVGRLDRVKNVLTVAEALTRLAAEGLPVHLLCAGEGADREAIFARLGMRASCPGALAPDVLARAYASADVVAHASHIEDASNVVLEALACGRPLLVAAESGSGRHVLDGDTGIVVEGNDALAWTVALRRVATDADLRGRLGARAAEWALGGIASWSDVLREDLVAVWERARQVLNAGPRDRA
jgi:glycosyltransferase involved in cell wall biosynthesis